MPATRTKLEPGEVRELPNGCFLALPDTFSELMPGAEGWFGMDPDHGVQVMFPEPQAERLREHIRARQNAVRNADRGQG